MKHLKLYEEFDKGGYVTHWDKFKSYLVEKGVDLNGCNINDFRTEFMDVVGNNELSSEEKAEQITFFLKRKCGSNIESAEIENYIDRLLMDEI